MATSVNKGILQYWPQILSMLTIVAAGGVFYNRVESAFQSINEIKDRQDRQFELYQKVETRLNDVDKRSEYYRGLRDGKNATIKNE